MPHRYHRRNDWRGVKRAIDELNAAGLGAELCVSYDRAESLSVPDQARLRMRVTREAEVPPRWPGVARELPGGSLSGRAKFAVLLAAPMDDDELFVTQGQVGGFMRAALARAGVDSSDVAYLTLVGQRMKNGEMPTNDAAIRQWRSWSLRAIEAANTPYVLLLGAHCVAAWRRDVSLDSVRLSRNGTGVGIWTVSGMMGTRQVLVGALQSPLAVRRDPLLHDEWQRGLTRWAWMVEEDRDTEAIGRVCAKKRCHEVVWAYDGDAVPWCRQHWKPGLTEAQAGYWTNKLEGQGELL
jgi:hypothetical protein